MTRLLVSTLLLFVIPICLGSCATVLNGKTQDIQIVTSKRISKLSIDSGFSVDYLEAGGTAAKTFYVRRGKYPLVIHLRLDTAKKTFVLRPRSSLAFWLNINFTDGLGLLVDWNKPERYAFPGRSYLYSKDTVVYRRRFAPIPPGTTRLSVGLLLFNSFSIRTPEGQYNSSGGLGLEAGLDYFYKEDRYLSLTAGVAGDQNPWAGKVVYYHYKGTTRTGNTFYAGIMANRVLNRFDIGYGIGLAGLNLTHNTYDDSVSSSQSSTSTVLGLNFSVQYRIGRFFRIGVLYHPDILSTNSSPAFHYQHYLSLGLAWKFPF